MGAGHAVSVRQSSAPIRRPARLGPVSRRVRIRKGLEPARPWPANLRDHL